MKFQYILPAFLVGAYAACPEAGSTDAQGRYSCNLAHQYPNGQTCKSVDGCPYLFNADGTVLDNKPAASATSSAPACPSAGSTNAKGYYSCNPAHQYPNEQKCNTVEGCYVLCDKDGKPIDNRATPTATPSGKCPAPGSTDAQGRYSCNPAHQYPSEQTCKSVDGCYYLADKNGNVVCNTTPTPAPTGKVCLAPGNTDSQGRYSCNPAHQYSNGQTCKLVDGCYYLSDDKGVPICNTTVVPVPKPSATGKVCPAAGSTDAQGRYSCNMAHQYPSGQTCTIVNGCPVLVSGDNKPQPSQVPVGAGSVVAAAPLLALAALGLAF